MFNKYFDLVLLVGLFHLKKIPSRIMTQSHLCTNEFTYHNDYCKIYLLILLCNYYTELLLSFHMPPEKLKAAPPKGPQRVPSATSSTQNTPNRPSGASRIVKRNGSASSSSAERGSLSDQHELDFSAFSDLSVGTHKVNEIYTSINEADGNVDDYEIPDTDDESGDEDSTSTKLNQSILKQHPQHHQQQSQHKSTQSFNAKPSTTRESTSQSSSLFDSNQTLGSWFNNQPTVHEGVPSSHHTQDQHAQSSGMNLDEDVEDLSENRNRFFHRLQQHQLEQQQLSLLPSSPLDVSTRTRQSVQSVPSTNSSYKTAPLMLSDIESTANGPWSIPHTDSRTSTYTVPPTSIPSTSRQRDDVDHSLSSLRSVSVSSCATECVCVDVSSQPPLSALIDMLFSRCINHVR